MIKAYDRLIAINPNDATAHTWRGQCLTTLGKPKEAFDAIKQAFEISPNDPSIHLIHGRCLQINGQIEEALHAFDKVISSIIASTTLTQSNAIRHIGECHYTLKQFPTALAAFDLFIKKDSNDYRGHFNRGRCLIMLERDNEALEAFTKATKLNPKKSAKHLETVVDYLYTQKKFTRALTVLNLSVKGNPNDYNAHVNRGHCFYGLNRHEKALAAYTRGSELKKNKSVNIPILKKIGRHLYKMSTATFIEPPKVGNHQVN